MHTHFFPAEQDQRVEAHQQAFVLRNVIGRAAELTTYILNHRAAPHHRPLAATQLIHQIFGSIDELVVRHAIRRWLT